jgi:hypothetical protein
MASHPIGPKASPCFSDMCIMLPVFAFMPCSTVPAVKTILHKCKPTYVRLPFATTGFEGVNNVTRGPVQDEALQGEDRARKAKKARRACSRRWPTRC